MVGRLVEQEKARLLQQQLSERNAHLPPAAELLAGALHVFAAEAEPLQDGAGARLQRIPLLEAELLADNRIPLHLPLVFRPRVLHLRQFLLQPADFPLQRPERLEHRQRLVQELAPPGDHPVLRQVTERQVPRADDVPFVRGGNPRKDLHQRRFSGTVVPDQADAVPIVDLEFEPAKEPFPAKRLAEPLDLQHAFSKKV